MITGILALGLLQVQQVEMEYGALRPSSGPTVETIGFYLSSRFQLGLGNEAGGEIPFGGRSHSFLCEGLDGPQPSIWFDVNGDGVMADLDRLAEYSGRRQGYVQGTVTVRDQDDVERMLRLTGTRRGTQNSFMIEDTGIRRGTLELAPGERIALLIVDANANGPFGDDPVYFDARGDGKITPVEQMAVGATVRIGERALRLASIAPSGATAEIEVLPAAEAGEAADVLAVLSTAPIPGNPFPDFEFVDQNGETVTNESLRGRVVLIMFWGSW